MGILNSTWEALRLIADRVVSVGALWLVLGVVLFEVQQAVRTRGWFHIVRAAYPDARRIRARDVCAAYLAGAGLNGILPARGGDVLKLWLLRRRAPRTRWSTLAATFVPETLFDTALGTLLVLWAAAMGFLPLPGSPTELPTLDVSLIARHPLISALVAVVLAVALFFAVRWLRTRARRLLRRLRRGLAILRTPRAYFAHVVPWQALARVIRLGSLAAYMRAFGLPVTPGSVLLVMAAQGGGRIIPIAPVSTGLRLAMLSYGLVEVTGESIDIGTILAFTVGSSGAQLLGSIVVALAALGAALGTLSPLRAVRAARRAVRAARAEQASPAPGG